jgi:hypothetical protein
MRHEATCYKEPNSLHNIELVANYMLAITSSVELSGCVLGPSTLNVQLESGLWSDKVAARLAVLEFEIGYLNSQCTDCLGCIAQYHMVMFWGI